MVEPKHKIYSVCCRANARAVDCNKHGVKFVLRLLCSFCLPGFHSLFEPVLATIYRIHTVSRQAVTQPLYKLCGGQPTAQAVVFAEAPIIGAVVYEQRSFRLLTGHENGARKLKGYPNKG